MKKGNKLKRIFATTAAFATLATTGVTATVHADDSSTNPGVTTDQMKQYGIEHGDLNSDGTNKTTSSNTKQPKIYNRYDFKKTYADGFIGGINLDGNMALQSQANKLPSTKDTPYLFHLFYIDYFFHLIQGNKNNPTNSNSKYHKGFVNGAKLYKEWLHINVHKAFSTKKQTNDPKQYYKTHKEVNYMEPGYSLTWLNKKIQWMNKNQNAALKEMRKYYNQSVLKDQRMESTKNDFDNTTLK